MGAGGSLITADLAVLCHSTRPPNTSAVIPWGVYVEPPYVESATGRAGKAAAFT
jgi:hypothetical protein